MVKLWEKLNQVHRTQVKYSLVASNWGGGLTLYRNTVENMENHSQLILYINTNDIDKEVILKMDDNDVDYTILPNGVSFITLYQEKWQNMRVTEDVWVCGCTDRGDVQPLSYLAAGQYIPIDLAGYNGIIVLISAQ